MSWYIDFNLEINHYLCIIKKLKQWREMWICTFNTRKKSDDDKWWWDFGASLNTLPENYARLEF